MTAITTTAVEAARAGGRVPKPSSVKVIVDQHFNSKVYTSGSSISGHALVKTSKDVHFDHFDIIFSGIAATRLDFVQQYPAHSFRPFMKLRMPLDGSSLPDNQVFVAGKTYRIPFHFVVPHQLTLGACNHQCSSPAVRDHHLRLPPTVGFWEADDQAPEMAHIEYSIKARAYRHALEPGAAPIKLMESQHVLKVLPSLPEDAPLDITFRDERYVMSKSKTIRKNLFSTKAGKLTATATQPNAIMLSADGHKASGSVVRINLRFAAISADNTPPRINSMSAKLATHTFFGAAPTDLMPNLGSRATYTPNPSLSYTTNNNLFTHRFTEKVEWHRHNSTGRRDSGYSSLGLVDEDQSETEGQRVSDQSGKKCPILRSAILEVPFSIPMNNRKLFLPTFHSCLISRTYTLHVNISLGPANASISLAIPLQIGVEAVHEPPAAELPSFESAVAELHQPDGGNRVDVRTLHFLHRSDYSDSLLPDYDEVNRRTEQLAH
ncbi:arrestin [Moelleriella libera RCEF 2490]|uniref:Arrestin n=1 Tax=Moelleriella libera RCEF 2490 TaxID=1081109 RepID=A0A168ANU2_9HYPO|nr:arrestin [Moelleriella libera RCEF 2490]